MEGPIKALSLCCVQLFSLLNLSTLDIDKENGAIKIKHDFFVLFHSLCVKIYFNIKTLCDSLKHLD